jgi:hypothetical protein
MTKAATKQRNTMGIDTQYICAQEFYYYEFCLGEDSKDCLCATSEAIRSVRVVIFNEQWRNLRGGKSSNPSRKKKDYDIHEWRKTIFYQERGARKWKPD